MQTDRNLLFGVLAFQDEYIDLAQLAAICRAWVADKSRSIPQLLVERQWLAESDRDELERKVERKLKRFVGDAHATLGAVADSAVRDVLRQVDDPDVRAAIPELADESRLGFHPDPIRSSPDRSGWNPNLQNDVDPASPSDTSEPRYTRGQLQGEGSFGIVWLAYDKQLDREVALKELKTSKSRNPDLWKRFLREAQVTGKLQHPNIVPVYELDPRSGGEQPFYTMKPVKGRTLRKAIDAFHQEHKGRPSETLELNRLLQSFVQVCEALAYAHSRDVVHRDLKPENIVLGDFGEVIVLDWGEAKLIGTPEPPPDETTETVQESDAPLVSSSPALRISGDAAQTPGTKLGTAKGSPGYMSPEQVRGDIHLMEPRTDVYGLGAILFDILIGHPPHQPTPEMKAKQQRLTIEDWRSIILANPTPRAREHNATIPVALDAICTKAMAAELSSRYSSANDLANDVQRYLADEPVSAYAEWWASRLRRWIRRRPTWSILIVLLLLVDLLSFLYSSLSLNRDWLAQGIGKDAVDEIEAGIFLAAGILVLSIVGAQFVGFGTASYAGLFGSMLSRLRRDIADQGGQSAPRQSYLISLLKGDFTHPRYRNENLGFFSGVIGTFIMIPTIHAARLLSHDFQHASLVNQMAWSVIMIATFSGFVVGTGGHRLNLRKAAAGVAGAVLFFLVSFLFILFIQRNH